MSVKENVKKLMHEIEEIALKYNRAPSDITVVAVSKTFTAEKIREAIEAGLRHIGENRVQEAQSKIDSLKDLPIIWHLVGHLQSNKARKAVNLFSVIQSIDKISTLEKVDRIAGETGKIQEIFVEVNTSGEETKFGVAPVETMKFLDMAIKFKNIKISGLMTIGPLTDNVQKIKNSFLCLKGLYEEAKEKFPELELKYLSMGMSDDYPIAIECGSNMLRIGRKIFGERRYS